MYWPHTIQPHIKHFVGFLCDKRKWKKTPQNVRLLSYGCRLVAFFFFNFIFGCKSWHRRQYLISGQSLDRADEDVGAGDADVQRGTF